MADCYDSSAYCASDSLCYSVDGFADCANVAELPGIAVDGPLLFDPGQDTLGTGGNLCTKAPACTNSGNVCQFSFQYYDPDGDVATSRTELLSRLRMVELDGTLLAPYDVLAADGSLLAILGCFDEADTTVSAAVVLLDEAGHQSNAICLEGSSP